jgi:hypothetical protein
LYSVYPMLPVYLACPFGFRYRLSAIAPMVSAVERVFVFLFFFRLVYHMLPVSLDYPFLIALRYSLNFICPIVLYRVHLTMTHTELNILKNANVNINHIFISFVILT